MIVKRRSYLQMETRVKFWNHGRVTPSTYINIEKQRSLAITMSSLRTLARLTRTTQRTPSVKPRCNPLQVRHASYYNADVAGLTNDESLVCTSQLLLQCSYLIPTSSGLQ